MARKSKEPMGTPRKNTGSRGNGTFKGFVDIPLTDAVRDNLMVEDGLAEKMVLGMIFQVAEDGYKFSFTYNSGLQSYIATITGREGSGQNEGYALSGFGNTPMQAGLALFGKHVVICNWGDWFGPDQAVQQELPGMR